MSDAEHTPDFVERSLMLPRRLLERLESSAEASGRELSELVIDALRLYIRTGESPQTLRGADVGSPDPEEAAEQEVADELSESEAAEAARIKERFISLRDASLDDDKLRQALASIMEGIERQEHFISGHSKAVADLARRTAEALQLPSDEVRAVEIAALVHDIGKTRVPESILGKRGSLESDEWKRIRKYPEHGADILSDLPALDPVVPLVRHHQERWDGSGYPNGLEGDAIPRGAHIVGICDVFHVLTSERVYRPALPEESAREVIAQAEDRLWDPNLCQKFLQVQGEE